jgi:N6-adenosine-specific RNA methylase IME4
VQPPAQPRKTALEIAAERRAALVSASLRRAPEQVQIVARNLGVDDPDVIDLFADGARNNAGWWEDIAASGFIQLTDETDAVAGSAGYKALREAIDLKARLHRQIAVEARRAEAASRAQSLAAKTYNVILADPPWEYDNKGVNGAAANHYDPMPLPDICALLNNYSFRVAPNAVLFLWTTAPFLRDAFAVIDAWDFTYKTNIVWVKTDLQKPGNGWYTRIHHEHLLVATRGSMTPLVNPSPPLSSVISAAVQEHSRKPDSVHTMLETLYPGCSYLELFARRSRPGWATFGNEIDQKEAAS